MGKQTKFIKESRQSNHRVSKYTGVRWNRDHSKWIATVLHNKVTYLCGLFDCEREAAKSRYEDYFFEFNQAITNFKKSIMNILKNIRQKNS
jgi:hypothetical protein